MTVSLSIRRDSASPVEWLVGLALFARSPFESRAGLSGTTTETDAEDVRGTLNGDGEAYRRLVERHQDRIAARLWRFTRDPRAHEELVQDVFVEAYQSLPTYRAKAPVEHWLARIATRVGYRYWKRHARDRQRPTVPLEEWDGALPRNVGTMAPGEAAELLHVLLAKLPARDRLVLTLRYVEDHTVADTARLTGWSQTMVKVQVWRARKKLRRLLERVEQG